MKSKEVYFMDMRDDTPLEKCYKYDKLIIVPSLTESIPNVSQNSSKDSAT